MKIVLDEKDRVVLKVVKLSPEEIKNQITDANGDIIRYKIIVKLPGGLTNDNDNQNWNFQNLRSLGLPVDGAWDLSEDILEYLASKQYISISGKSDGGYTYQVVDTKSAEPVMYNSHKELTKDVIKHIQEQEEQQGGRTF